MILLNKSAQIICCLINDELQLILYPNERTVADIVVTDITKFQLSHVYGSSYGDCFNLPIMYQIVINTTFTFSNLCADSILYISREKVHFEFNHTYDRFFINCDDGHIIQEVHNVADLEGLCSIATNSHTQNEACESLIGFIFEGHFLQTTVLFVIFKLCFWANNWSFPIWLILLFWGAGYLLRLASEKSFNAFQKSTGTPELHLLQKYASCEYIKNYYANPHRKWIANNIENE